MTRPRDGWQSSSFKFSLVFLPAIDLSIFSEARTNESIGKLLRTKINIPQDLLEESARLGYIDNANLRPSASEV
jgi:hypothetical protein